MANIKKWTALIIGLLAILGILIAAVKFIFIDFFVDLWWFQAQGMTSYYFLRLLYPYLILIFFTILFFAIFYVNFRVASRVIGFEDKPDGYKEKKWLKYLNHALRDMYIILSFVMALIIAIPIFRNWENSLLFLFGNSSDVFGSFIRQGHQFLPFFSSDLSFAPKRSSYSGCTDARRRSVYLLVRVGGNTHRAPYKIPESTLAHQYPGDIYFCGFMLGIYAGAV